VSAINNHHFFGSPTTRCSACVLYVLKFENLRPWYGSTNKNIALECIRTFFVCQSDSPVKSKELLYLHILLLEKFFTAETVPSVIILEDFCLMMIIMIVWIRYVESKKVWTQSPKVDRVHKKMFFWRIHSIL
jgi:hypothetical protein